MKSPVGLPVRSSFFKYFFLLYFSGVIVIRFFFFPILTHSIICFHHFASFLSNPLCNFPLFPRSSHSCMHCFFLSHSLFEYKLHFLHSPSFLSSCFRCIETSDELAAYICIPQTTLPTYTIHTTHTYIYTPSHLTRSTFFIIHFCRIVSL